MNKIEFWLGLHPHHSASLSPWLDLGKGKDKRKEKGGKKRIPHLLTQSDVSEIRLFRLSQTQLCSDEVHGPIGLHNMKVI